MFNTWVALSHFCPKAGLAFFFEVKGPYLLRQGSLVHIYLGNDTKRLPRLSYRKALNLETLSEYVLAHSGAQYMVDDGFDKTNVYFLFNKDLRRIKVRTTGPILPGKYEALVDYYPPLYPFSCWNLYRRQKLPTDTLARFETTYSARPSTKRNTPGWPK
jgi:hypothetical protein